MVVGIVLRMQLHLEVFMPAYVIVSDVPTSSGSWRQLRVLADGRVLTRVTSASGARVFVLSRTRYAWVRYPVSVLTVLVRFRGARAWARRMQEVHGR